ncbi:MAG: sodium-dependent transporter [Treponemataceae bacterium]
MEQKEKRNTFSGSLGFVLAAAGSAVGLGNIWRFPYLAAKDGGGIFLLVYIILVVTFGFALLITEIAIGRKTKQSPLTAYSTINKKWGFLGIFGFVVPLIIYPYYCAIGGWVLRYSSLYFAMQGHVAVAEGSFSGFITDPAQSIFYCFIFAALCFAIVYKGVENGIEKYSKIMMPILVIFVLIISIYSFFIKYVDENGVTRNGIQGVIYYVVPNFEGMTFKKFLIVCLDAMGQLFYSLSIAMGIMIAYGSYMKDKVDLNKSVNQIQIFDTGVAFLAGLMVIPSVFVFSGVEGMKAGPGLMFITLPKVFNSMGNGEIGGTILGILFFIMVLFAALTSSVSILEAIVSSIMDRFKWKRETATILMAGIGFIISIIVCLGYSVFYFEFKLPNGTTAQLLDIFDYISNNVLMPLGALLTCIFIGWIIKPKWITDEIQKNGEIFRRKLLYKVMVKYIAPILLFVLFITSTGIFNKL